MTTWRPTHFCVPRTRTPDGSRKPDAEGRHQVGRSPARASARRDVAAPPQELLQVDVVAVAVVEEDQLLHLEAAAARPQAVEKEVQRPAPPVEDLRKRRVHIFKMPLLSLGPSALLALVVLPVELVHDPSADGGVGSCIVLLGIRLVMAHVIVDQDRRIHLVHREHVGHDVELVGESFVLHVLLGPEALLCHWVDDELPPSSSLGQAQAHFVLVGARARPLVGSIPSGAGPGCAYYNFLPKLVWKKSAIVPTVLCRFFF